MSAPPATATTPAVRMVGWDARRARDAALVALLAFALVTLVTALTDEGGVRWGERLGRALPTVPLCAALGTYLASARARTRSEMLGLAALGRSPGASALGTVLGGALFAWLASAILAASPAVDVGGFFPSVVRAAEIEIERAAPSEHVTFVVPRHGVRVLGDGTLAVLESSSQHATHEEEGLPAHARLAAILVTLLAGTALPLAAATARTRPRRHIVAATLSALAATVLLFHAAAAHRIGAPLSVLPACALLAVAWVRYRRWGWEL